MRSDQLTCSIQLVGPGDAALAANVRADLIQRGIEVCDRSCDDDVAQTALTVCAELNDSAQATVERLAGSYRRVLVVAGCQASANESYWRLLARGASDVVTWHGDEPGAEILCRLQRWHQIDATIEAPLVRGQLVGRSKAWLEALGRLVEIACFTSSSVLLAGESGTGKELVARLCHHLDPRKDKRDLIVVDCTTIVPTLSGSELFGHERGAFTGAMSAREGAFAAADRGTLFLDEVGELPLTLQAELLRVIQEGTYKRVGADQWRKTRFRLVCATNRDLAAELAAGRFRLDLFHRLAANVIRLPPLRERPGDVLPLFEHFLKRAVGSDLELHPAVVQLLEQRNYPGNVRDLGQLALRIAVRHVGPGPVTPGDVPDEERPVVPSLRTGDAMTPPEEEVHLASQDRTEGLAATMLDRAVAGALREGWDYRGIRGAAGDAAVRLAVQRAGGDLNMAARLLGVTRRMLEQRRANES